MADLWPDGFSSGDRVTGKFGEGTVATRQYCLGDGLEFKGKRVQGTGVRSGVVPVIYDTVGHFWEGPLSVKRLDDAGGRQDG